VLKVIFCSIDILLTAGGVLSSLIGILAVKLIKSISAHTPLRAGTFISAGLIIVIAAGLSFWMFGNMRLFYAVLSGIITGVVIAQTTEYYTYASF
jgi:K(+)-stimulated pyrophosphate-energized sodium pump